MIIPIVVIGAIITEINYVQSFNENKNNHVIGAMIGLTIVVVGIFQ